MKTLNNIWKAQSEDHEGDSDLATIEEVKVKKPSRYKVLLHNDDYTTMEFVIFILQSIFGKTFDEAKVVMLKVHNEGTGVCGIYTHEIAETKSSKVRQLAKENGHPLLCSIEEE
ncbi:MAG: ATP-dependent Clp protease adapter ClpS [Bacteriovoracaceae bacterium]